MKTAISQPDDLFRRAEATARKLHISRSELYARALAEFLEKRDGAAVTSRLDEVYSKQHSKLDERIRRAQAASLDRDTW